MKVALIYEGDEAWGIRLWSETLEEQNVLLRIWVDGIERASYDSKGIFELHIKEPIAVANNNAKD